MTLVKEFGRPAEKLYEIPSFGSGAFIGTMLGMVSAEDCRLMEGDRMIVRFLPNRFGLIGLSISLLTLNSCSFSSSPNPEIQRRGAFEVKVKSNGKEVKDFQQDLVHRKELSRGVLAELQDYSKKAEITFPHKDANGNFQGLKVKKATPPNVLSALGLLAGDVVTAFGMKRVEPDMSFMEFLLSLDALDDSSITLLRKGQAHKVLYLIPGKVSLGGGNLNERSQPTSSEVQGSETQVESGAGEQAGTGSIEVGTGTEAREF